MFPVRATSPLTHERRRSASLLRANTNDAVKAFPDINLQGAWGRRLLTSRFRGRPPGQQQWT